MITLYSDYKIKISFHLLNPEPGPSGPCIFRIELKGGKSK